MNSRIDTRLLALGVAPDAVDFFLNFDLPLFRKPRPTGTRRWPHIEVGGDCLRVGKTTAKQVIAEQIGSRGWPFVFSDEDWKANRHLKKSYQGFSEDLFLSQKWFARRKRAQLNTIADTSFWIQVVHPEMDFCYAMTNFLVGRLSKRQFLAYWEYYRGLRWETVSAPDLLVYLTASADVLLKRFYQTARDFEKADEVYIYVMQLVNQRWLQSAMLEWSILVVDTNDFDFSYATGSLAARERLGEVLFARLSADGWKT